MKKNIFSAFALGCTVLFSACAGQPPKEVTISKDVLMDKIKGGWAGQAIGCTFGGPTEFRYPGTMINPHINIEWPEHYLTQYFDNGPGLYDDIYMDLTFVEVFDKLGLDAPIEAFAEAFAGAKYPLWHANQQARYNIRQGIMPPDCGYWENNPHADDIDFQIEADYDVPRNAERRFVLHRRHRPPDELRRRLVRRRLCRDHVCPGLRL